MPIDKKKKKKVREKSLRFLWKKKVHPQTFFKKAKDSTSRWDQKKGQGITRVISIHPPGTMKALNILVIHSIVVEIIWWPGGPYLSGWTECPHPVCLVVVWSTTQTHTSTHISARYEYLWECVLVLVADFQWVKQKTCHTFIHFCHSCLQE